MQPKPIKTITAPVAAASSLQKMGDKSKLKLARAVHKGAGYLAKQSGEVIVASAPSLKALADTGAKLHGWVEASAGQTIRLELIAQAGEQPLLDISAEVTPIDGQD